MTPSDPFSFDASGETEIYLLPQVFLSPIPPQWFILSLGVTADF